MEKWTNQASGIGKGGAFPKQNTKFLNTKLQIIELCRQFWEKWDVTVVKYLTQLKPVVSPEDFLSLHENTMQILNSSHRLAQLLVSHHYEDAYVGRLAEILSDHMASLEIMAQCSAKLCLWSAAHPELETLLQQYGVSSDTWQLPKVMMYNLAELVRVLWQTPREGQPFTVLWQDLQRVCQHFEKRPPEIKPRRLKQQTEFKEQLIETLRRPPAPKPSSSPPSQLRTPPKPQRTKLGTSGTRNMNDAHQSTWESERGLNMVAESKSQGRAQGVPAGTAQIYNPELDTSSSLRSIETHMEAMNLDATDVSFENLELTAWQMTQKVIETNSAVGLNLDQINLIEHKYNILKQEERFLFWLRRIDDFMTRKRLFKLVSGSEYDLLVRKLKIIQQKSDLFYDELNSLWEDDCALTTLAELVQAHVMISFPEYIDYRDKYQHIEHCRRSLSGNENFAQVEMELREELGISLEEALQWPLPKLNDLSQHLRKAADIAKKQAGWRSEEYSQLMAAVADIDKLNQITSPDLPRGASKVAEPLPSILKRNPSEHNKEKSGDVEEDFTLRPSNRNKKTDKAKVRQKTKKREVELKEVKPYVDKKAKQAIVSKYVGDKSWKTMREVEKKCKVDTMDRDEVKLCESKFEILKKQAQFTRALDVLLDFFVNQIKMVNILSKKESDVLFSWCNDMAIASEKLFKAMEEYYQTDVAMQDMFQVLNYHMKQSKWLDLVKSHKENHSRIDRHLDNLTNMENSNLGMMVNVIETHESAMGWKLRDCLALPLTRISELKTQLKELKQYVPSKDADDLKMLRRLLNE